ncbi:MAG: ABC transporter ATP-binding protein [Nitrospinota bacterium]
MKRFTLLRIEGLITHYERVPALREINLRVEEGEIVAVIGANGAGKTTLINTISGLVRPTKGRIEFQGEAVHRLPVHQVLQRGIVQVPEGRKVFPDMTVFENLKIGAYLQKDRDAVQKTLEEVIAHFPILAERRALAAGSLSGGEQQMLAIGRALMSQPKLLMLDEPSLGLAPLFVARVAEIVRGVHQRGITILLVEQRAKMALTLADRGYVMETGKIVIEGTSGELRSNNLVKKAYLGM